MYVAVQHQVKDWDTMLARGENLPENAPPGVHARQFCPSQDKTAATCLWEADSVDAVREYIDSTLGDSSENSYFEIDTEYAIGLPETAAAST